MPKPIDLRTDKVQEILDTISRVSPHYRASPNLPDPFIGTRVKAILLGADPGTNNDIRFTYVFKLEDGMESPYFRQFRANLKTIELSLDNLYVQNLCRNYFDCDTHSHKKDWMNCAIYWVGVLKKELDEFDANRSIPVLVSAEVILRPLCEDTVKEPEYYYSKGEFIKEDQNTLGRMLIPFWRGGAGKYALTKPQWLGYTDKIGKYLKGVNTVVSYPMLPE